MRILLVVDRLYRGGGTETHILTLAKGLQRRGHEVTIYTSGGAWVAKALKSKIHVVVQPTMRNLSHKDVITFVQLLKHRHFDVIHSHEPLGCGLTQRAQRYLGVRLPLIFTLHGSYIWDGALRMVGRSTKRVISVSVPMRNLAVTTGRMSPKKVIIIPNGIETQTFTPSQQDHARSALGISLNKFTIGYASRFTHDKAEIGLRVVRVLNSFARNHNHVEVLVAGRGSQQVVKSSRDVKVLGHVDDMARFLSACDVVVGTGRVAAEALVCGKPVIMIGANGYHGLLTSKNIQTMINYNFGDHGTRYQGWTAERLMNEMSRVQRNIKQIRQETDNLRTGNLEKLSASRMVDRVLKVYQVVSAEQ